MISDRAVSIIISCCLLALVLVIVFDVAPKWATMTRKEAECRMMVQRLSLDLMTCGSPDSVVVP